MSCASLEQMMTTKATKRELDYLYMSIIIFEFTVEKFLGDWDWYRRKLLICHLIGSFFFLLCSYNIEISYFLLCSLISIYENIMTIIRNCGHWAKHETERKNISNIIFKSRSQTFKLTTKYLHFTMRTRGNAKHQKQWKSRK